MVIMLLEKTSQALRGELTRWLVEVKPGVYIGHVNGMVRDRLWEKCSLDRRAGSVFQAWASNNEQHYHMRLVGDTDREIVCEEGLELVFVKKESLNPVQKKRIRRAI